MCPARDRVCIEFTQGGIGLVEVLVAMLVLAVGLLGLMRMQLAAKQASFEAAQRTQATGLARDMLERIRSNPVQLNAYLVNGLGSSSSPPAAESCVPAVCSPAQLARHDIHDWYQSMRGAAASVTVEGITANAAGFVEPRACISNDAGHVTVAIAWRGISSLTTPGDTSAYQGSNCGLGEGAFGDGDRLRRLLVMSTYIGQR